METRRTFPLQPGDEASLELLKRRFGELLAESETPAEALERLVREQPALFLGAGLEEIDARPSPLSAAGS